MPPISITPFFLNTLSSLASRRLAAFTALAVSALLAGCATTDQASSGTSLRSTYQAQATADPLGAYLAMNEFGSSYSTSRGYDKPAASPRAMASTALQHLGVKYKFGGDEPNTGFDCSGLVIYAAEKSLGLKLPRRAAEIAQQGTPIEKSELKKGDLVFFNTLGHRFSHVGIYLGDNQFVHAPRAGSVVRVEDMTIAYWQKRYNGARRLNNDGIGLDASSVLTMNK